MVNRPYNTSMSHEVVTGDGEVDTLLQATR